MPRLLHRNQRAIASSVDAPDRARLLAQRALLLARHWRAEELPDALAAAEAAVAASADRLAQAELWLARGVAMYYGVAVAQATAPLQLALERAKELADAGLEAECEAWLGCVGATMHRAPAELLGRLDRAIALGMTHRPLAAARAIYLLATLHQEAGLGDEAVQHYRRASAIARAEQDEQLVAAIMRYMTLGQVQQVRRAQAAGEFDAELCRQALAALGSAQQLARALTSDEQCLQLGLRLGEMLRVSGDDAGALAAFAEHLDAAEQRGLSWEAAIARADQAVCLARSGHVEAARRAAARARSGLDDAHDAYSRALIHASLAELAQRLGDADAAALGAQAQQHWAEDRRWCDGLRAALREFEPSAG